MHETQARSPREKAAILLISLGREYSSKVLQQMSEEEIEQLTVEIANVRRIDNQTKLEVLREFGEACLAQNYILEGGIEYARDILNHAVGQQKACELISKLSTSLQARPFDFARRLDSAQILNIIKNEQTQTIALILSYLSPRQAAEILGALPHEIQTDVIGKIAHMGKTSPEHIREIEKIMERKLTSLGYTDFTRVGGIETTVSILNSIDRSTEKFILENLESVDARLVEEIKSKMFLFEDIVKLDRLSLQRVLKDISNDDLVLALKGVKPQVSEYIFENMSRRLQDMIKEEMAIKGPVKLRDVEEAQQKIVMAIRRLDETGEIIIVRGKEELID
jgi:flagellar motor switch protein FliG